MACTYSVNDQDSLSLARVLMEFYKSKTPLANSNIYSSNAEDSTLESIHKQIVRRDEIGKLERIPLTKFISQQNEETLKPMGISASRLSPEYDAPKRVYQSVVNKLVESGHTEDSLKDMTLAEIKADPTLSESIEYEKDILEVMEAEEKTNKLIIAIKNAVGNIADDFESNDPRAQSKLTIATAVKEAVAENLIEAEQATDLNTKLNSIVDEISKVIFTRGTPMFDILLTTEGEPPFHISGHIDFVTVTSEGVPHIYSIKSSKRGFEKWDSAKKLQSDYQLAFERALLGQYTDVSHSDLTIIPIETGSLVGGKLDPKALTKGNEQVRNGDPKAGLIFNDGMLFKIANKFIPDSIKLETNPDRELRLINTLVSLLPKYKIRTTRREYHREKLVEDILKQAYFTVNKADLDQFVTENPLDEDSPITAKSNRIAIKNFTSFTEAEKVKKAGDIADQFLSFLDNKDNRNVIQLKSAITVAINAGNANKLELSSENQQKQARHALQPYLNGQYAVIESVSELDSLGIILLRNTSSGQIIPIAITANNFLSKYDNKYTYLDAEYFKVFAVLNEMYDDLKLNLNKIQDIVILDVDQGVSKQRNIREAFSDFQEVAAKQNYQIRINKDSDLPEFKDVVFKAINGVLRTYDSEEKESVYNLFANIRGNMLDAPLEDLRAAEKGLRELFGLGEKTFNSAVDFKRPAEYLYALVKSLILTRYGIVPEGDVTGLRDYAIKYQDFFGVLKAFYSDNLDEYNKEQEKILGIIGGLKTTTPDKIASKDLFTINGIITGSISLMRHEIDKLGSQVHGDTTEYYADIHYTQLEQQMIGDYRKHFNPLWLHEGNKLSNKWQVKNPYNFEKDNVMLPAQRKYLTNILFKIQRQLMHIPNDIAEKIDPTSIETIQKTAPKKWVDKIMFNIENGEYFRMPLIWTNTISQYKGVVAEGGKGLKRAARTFGANVRDFVDGRELDPKDRNEAEKVSKGYYEMYEIYGKQSASYIAQQIEDRGDWSFEIDLDAIAHRVIQEKVRKKYVDNILPVLNDYAWWIQLTGAKQNKDVSKALTYIQERIDMAFYDRPIIDKEFSDIISAAGVAKKITTAQMLAFRPAILVKELAIGMYKGAALAATQFFGKDQFTFADYGKALGMMLTIDKQMSLEFNKIEALNKFYAFANMDLNSYARKIQTNRRGIFMGLHPYMYACNTIPDYYNRMSLFVAKMIHDESMDAHTLDKNGFITYDPRKDKRFSHYLSVREQYRAPSGKYIFLPSATDTKYNEQKQMYDVIREEINDQRRIAKMKEFGEEDLIDQAYSEKERSSYKSYTDTVYGYYDKEQSPSWHYTVFGLLYLQFMQFWPGKMDMWFGKPVDESTKITGVHRQATELVDGKKIKLWRKAIHDENTGEIVGFDHVRENTGDPLIEWTGLPHEGVVFSMAKTIRDTYKGLCDHKSFTEIAEDINTQDELRLNRVKYGLADGALMYLVFCLFKLLLEAAFGDNPEGMTAETKAFSMAVNKKMINEAMLWNNTFGNLRSEPAFWTYGLKVMGDVKDTMDGDKTIKRLLTDVKAFEFIDTDQQS